MLWKTFSGSLLAMLWKKVSERLLAMLWKMLFRKVVMEKGFWKAISSVMERIF